MNNQQTTQSRAMKKLYALTEKRPIDVSLSENPLGCSPLVSGAIKTMKIHFNDYPSPNGRLLKDKLSEKFSLQRGNFFVANGSESIIHDIPKIFGKALSEVLVPALSFPMFAICSELANKKVIKTKMSNELGIDLAEMLKAISPQTSLIFICNPNNPTGSVLSKSEILQFMNSIPEDILVIVDEANIEFGGESMINEVTNRNNLIVLKTFSKGFGLATLRVGFAAANEAIIQKLEEETPIFQTSSVSEQLACIALDDDQFLERTKRFVSGQRAFLKTELEKLKCIVFPSEANNLFVKIPESLKADLFTEQLKQKGVSVVMGSNFDGFDDTFFRVSMRDEKTNELFTEKMRKIFSKIM